MVSLIVYMVTHWIKPMINHDIKLSVVMIHQVTKLHELLTLRDY